MAANGSLRAIEVAEEGTAGEEVDWANVAFFALGIAFWWLIYSHLLDRRDLDHFFGSSTSTRALISVLRSSSLFLKFRKS